MHMLTVTGWSHEDTQEVGHRLSLSIPSADRTRYSEFEDLHTKLLQTFPHAAGSMPHFPPKSVICKSHGRLQHHSTKQYSANASGIARFRPRFLEKRKQGLSYFLKCVYR